jgi:hypothetical protein
MGSSAASSAPTAVEVLPVADRDPVNKDHHVLAQNRLVVQHVATHALITAEGRVEDFTIGAQCQCLVKDIMTVINGSWWYVNSLSSWCSV